MVDEDRTTVDLLQAWHAGDPHALEDLVARELPWLSGLVHRRLGALLRSRHETQDIVQEALLVALREGPKFVVDDRRHLRALLARLVENVIRREWDHLTAGRRDVRRATSLPQSDVVLSLSSHQAFTPPTRAAQADEERAWVRLALELLDVEDRDVIVLREYRGLTFVAMGEALGIREDAARMRWQRALGRLGKVLDRLRSGRLGELLVTEAVEHP